MKLSSFALFRTSPRCAAQPDRNRRPESDFLHYCRPARTFADCSTQLEAPLVSSRPSFQKRQKEQARKEKQRLKAERKQQRKLERETPQPDTPEAAPTVAEGQDS
jgi:hypothetical protein